MAKWNPYDMVPKMYLDREVREITAQLNEVNTKK
jgi:hypothetical protein